MDCGARRYCHPAIFVFAYMVAYSAIHDRALFVSFLPATHMVGLCSYQVTIGVQRYITGTVLHVSLLLRHGT